MASKMERAADSCESLAVLLSEMLNVEVTRQDVEAPTSDFMRRAFCGVFRDAGMCRIAFEEPQVLVPEHVSGFVPIMHLNRLMQTVFCKLGVFDFGIADITDPKPERSRRLLTILVNFCLRLRRQWNTWSDIEVGLAAVKADLEAKKVELDAVKDSVNQLSQHAAMNLEGLAAVQEELAAQQEPLETFGSKQALLRLASQELMNAACPLNERRKKSERELLGVKCGVQAVRAKICRPPERQRRFAAEEAETASKLQEERRRLETTVKTLHQKRQLAERQRKALAQLKGSLCSKFDAGQRLESLLQDKEEVSALRSTAEDNYHRLLKEQEAVAENKSQLKSQAEIKLQATECKLGLKTEELDQAVQRLKVLRLQCQELVCSKDSEVAGLDAEIRKVEDEAKKFRLSLANEVEETRRNVQQVYARQKAMLKMAERAFFPDYKEPPKDADGGNNV
ncbi:myosin-9 [Ixodes scapularis]|uniref:myosin-9 n=1 Tax=Ixodes scapularis TaxID=6945 RepID=UPI00116177DD|nr:myosin-9 [Ixodes scapularis]